MYKDYRQVYTNQTVNCKDIVICTPIFNQSWLVARNRNKIKNVAQNSFDLLITLISVELEGSIGGQPEIDE